MKQIFLIILAVSLFSLLLAFANSNNAAAAGKLYDDFSAEYIDDDKFARRELVREIAGGKLILKMGNASGYTTEVRTSPLSSQESGLMRGSPAM